jgi:hypothetical protein
MPIVINLNISTFLLEFIINYPKSDGIIDRMGGQVIVGTSQMDMSEILQFRQEIHDRLIQIINNP